MKIYFCISLLKIHVFLLILLSYFQCDCVNGEDALTASALAGLKAASSARCGKVYRQPAPTLQYGCGACLPGYTENVNSICKPDCPSALECEQKRREVCTSSTNGQCGECKVPYIEVYGRCMDESVVDNLITKIESYFGNMETVADSTTSQVKPEVQGILLESSTRAQLGEVIDKRMPAPVSSGRGKAAGTQASAAESATSSSSGFSNVIFFGVVSAATLLCIVCLVIAGICWYRFYKIRKSMRPSEYVGYGSVYGEERRRSQDMSRSESSGDRKLAQSAQMYHYQQVKQQMLALEKSENNKQDESDLDDGEENEDGNYTVYECPGLAPAGEMEVSNPVFLAGNKSSHSSTPSPPSSPPQVSPQSLTSKKK